MLVSCLTSSLKILFHSFIHHLLYSPLLGPCLFFSFVIFFTQKSGLPERGISPSQGRYLRAGQHKHRMNAHTDIHALNGIRTYDPSVRASENILCLRPRGNCDQPSLKMLVIFSSETSVDFLRTTRCHIPEGAYSHFLWRLPSSLIWRHEIWQICKEEFSMSHQWLNHTSVIMTSQIIWTAIWWLRISKLPQVRSSAQEGSVGHMWK
jgi:hypothetical protein